MPESAVMTAEPRILRTQAEKDLLDLWRRKPERADSAVIATLRDAAIARFDKAGLPHRRVEEYKYTDLRALLKAVPPLAGRADVEAARAAAGPAAEGEVRLVFVDGHFEPALSGALPKGVTVESLANLLPHGHTLGDRLGLSTLAMQDPLVGLNTAFMRDGLVIRVAARTKVAERIAIEHVATGAHAAFLRHAVAVEDQAEATFVERYRGPADTASHVNAVVELTIGDGATVHWVKLQTEGLAAAHFSTLVVDLSEKAELDHFALGAGAVVARAQVFARFSGEHATLSTRAATLLEGRRHADATLVVDHAVPHGTSRELYRAVIDGEAKSVFQGKIVVRQHAQKTDGKMASNAVLLTDAAEAMNKPELEIFADDVVCGHGATAGELDERLKFYLMSRGIPAAEAETLLIMAFLGEAVDTIADEVLRDQVTAEIEAWLERRAAAKAA
jgi:Fe-S cluster assembly protein SufD